MPDLRFHQPPGAQTLSELAERAALRIEGDPDLEITGVAPLHQAGPTDLSFLDNVKYRDDFQNTQAGACVVHPDMVKNAPGGTALLLSDHPYKSYAEITQILYPEPWPDSHMSDSAVIDDTASLGRGCTVEAGAVIKSGAEIGEGCWIGSGAVIGKNVVIGDACRIGDNAVISHAYLGRHVRVYPGVCIGQDGFGFAIDPSGFVKVPQLGRVIIEDSVEIGANTTIDRGAGPDTVIGSGTWIDNLVQIGHNVKIGKCCVIVAQVGISGSTVLEDFVVLAGQSGVAGHITIGKGTKVGAQSGVIRDIPPGQEYLGSPAMPIKTFMKQVAFLKKIVKNKNDNL